VRALLTGADGFAGGWLARQLLAEGHDVVGTHRRGGTPSRVLDPAESQKIEWRELELGARESVEQVVRGHFDVVCHLAAVSSGSEARSDPGLAWEVNAAGTARLAEALADRRAEGDDPLLLVISTAEVYGSGEARPRRETDPVRPCSPYAASKAGAEIAALEVAGRTGLRVMIARPFPHTGPGQDTRFVLPALAGRLGVAKRLRAPAIKAGAVDVVRDFLDVRDATSAYRVLIERGEPGTVYNVASGEGHSIGEMAERLMGLLQWDVIIETDASLVRRADIPHLVGDPSRMRSLGWTPTISLDRTLKDLLDAQTH
jgi:GDP-4-dehydro-6-deoxy-D-mannose reductase